VATADQPHHPSVKRYWQIALFLGIVTAVEIGIAYIPDLNKTILTVSLLALGVVKFGVVVGWFMHLKFENRTMNSLFAIGLVFALGLFFIVLATYSGLLAS
jgi:cytochrome c oxidase subunit 4